MRINRTIQSFIRPSETAIYLAQDIERREGSRNPTPSIEFVARSRISTLRAGICCE